MTRALVIVESPAKAKTIKGYLGDDFVVESSIGHVRDLPSRAAEVPKAYKSEPWARLGIDVDNGFKPLYVVNSDKREQIRKLRSLLSEAEELYLATDEDREGEAIAWHLLEVLNPRVPVKRMVFHEITRAAIRAAVESPRELDRRLVDAQEARRMLDRLYGYEVSPVLWKKVMPQLSAGRVQSVAIRIVVERERERMAFVSAGYWSLTGTFFADPSQDAAGANGATGATRVAGEAGAIVEVGGVGTAGEAGATGATVEAGASGEAGATVEVGGVGTAGEAGATGAIVEAGASVEAGAIVEVGGVGTAGEAGATGAAGASGEAGATGEAESRSGRFKAVLAELDGNRVATGRDFDSEGNPTKRDVTVLDEPRARALAAALEGSDFVVRSRRAKPYRRRPAAPFITSTLQQEAARKLSMSSAAAMRAAQSLYEQGYITYMRTDSTALSDSALTAARAAVAQRFGDAALPSEPRKYASKVKNAQEAHEAIRPSGDTFVAPEAVAKQVPRSEARLYELVWQRTLASQMHDCTGQTVQLRIGTPSGATRDAVFAASGTVITDLGFRRVYTEGADADDRTEDDREMRLPAVAEGDPVRSDAMEPAGHTTQPPARYTEASLVRRLEQLGVGRPSTYSSIMGTITNRGYVWRKGMALVPSFTAFSVVNLLERHFPKLVDYSFTAQMEDDLDRIATGVEEAVPWLGEFYFGNDDDPGLKEKVSSRLNDIDARVVNSIPLGVDSDGVGVEVRVGRYGPSVRRGDDTVPVPEDTEPDELDLDKALQLLEAPNDEQVLGKDPATGLDVLARQGRYGPYVQLGRVEELSGRPKFASLFKTMTLETVTLDEALQLLSLPRLVGQDPSDGVEITVQNGRYGPYLKKGSDSRSLASEQELFTITLDGCLKLLAQPKRRRGATQAPPLRELGPDPDTGRDLVIKDGRYGHYVTDGETNASLRTGDTVEKLTVERASELLAERRAKGSAPKRATSRKKPAASRKSSTKQSPTRKRPPKQSPKRS